MRSHKVRLTVKATMIIILIFGCALGWIVRLAQVQRNAVAEITKVGGSVSYEWSYKKEISEGGILAYYWEPDGQPPGPKWLVKYLGYDYLGRVLVVHHAGPSQYKGVFTDADMVHVAKLTGLADLWLNDSCVTDAGLANVRGLTDLWSLRLDKSAVTDAGLAHISGLTRLFELDLTDCQISDAGLLHIKDLMNLQYIDLSNTEITDSGLMRLTGFPRLRRLTIKGCRITNKGLRQFAQKMPAVEIMQ